MRRFFFFEKTASASTSKLGAIIISKNILFSSFAVDTSHFLFIATTPPKAERGSTPKAFRNADLGVLAEPIPQGEPCFTITQEGFLNS